MPTHPDATLPVPRRYVLIGTTALIAVLAAGGVGYEFWTFPDTAAAQSGLSGEVSMADLLVPSPLRDEIQGQADAPVTIVEYSLMSFPHSSHCHPTHYPQM